MITKAERQAVDYFGRYGKGCLGRNVGTGRNVAGMWRMTRLTLASRMGMRRGGSRGRTRGSYLEARTGADWIVGWRSNNGKDRIGNAVASTSCSGPRSTDDLGLKRTWC